jgi:cohesin loading factor subunit SCC2
VSVRKRVIKILRDICLEYPNYNKIPEMCVKMIRRINDEEGIRKLVMEVFQHMWFMPVAERNPTQEEEEQLVTRAQNITDVVVACRDTGLEWFEQLLQTVREKSGHKCTYTVVNEVKTATWSFLQLFRPREDKEDATKKNTEPPPHLVLACQQIVDCLVASVLRIEENSIRNSSANINGDSASSAASLAQKGLGSSHRIVACIKTLYLFSKICPQLLVPHVQTLQPYLQIECHSQGDYQIISSIAHTLELAVPLIKHPSEIFLAQLEEDAVKLILKHDKKVIAACISCLGSIVNSMTKNFKLIRDCFSRYYRNMEMYREAYKANPKDPRLSDSTVARFRRAMYTVSLLLRHFDFSQEDLYSGLSVSTLQCFRPLFALVVSAHVDISEMHITCILTLLNLSIAVRVPDGGGSLRNDFLVHAARATSHPVRGLGSIGLYMHSALRFHAGESVKGSVFEDSYRRFHASATQDQGKNIIINLLRVHVFVPLRHAIMFGFRSCKIWNSTYGKRRFE